MRKRIVLAAVAALTLGLAACSGGSTFKAAPTTTTTTPFDPGHPSTGVIPPKPARTAATVGFPNTGNTGVPAGTVLKIAAHSTTACTNCPPGITWDTNHGYVAKTCGVSVDGWKFDDSFGLAGGASNGTHAVGATEVATKAASCVSLTKSLVAPKTGANGQCGICTGYTGGGGNYNCSPGPCGPIYVADTEVSMPQSPIGFSYACDDTNLHLFRIYVHGTIQGCNSDGYSEVTNSLLVSDRVDTACVQSSGANCAHGDALFQDGGPAGSWWKATHNTFQILANPSNYCSADVGLFGDNAAPNGATFINNLFKQTNGLCYYCVYTGASQPSKPFKPGVNITFRDNVFEKGANGKCGDAGVAADWATGNGNVSCNNKFDDGTTAIADTTGCVSTPTTTVPPTTTTTVPVTIPPTTTTTVTIPPTTTTTVTVPPTTTTTTVEPTVTWSCVYHPKTGQLLCTPA